MNSVRNPSALNLGSKISLINTFSEFFHPASMMAGLARGGRKKKRNKQGSIMKFRIKDIPKLHPQMNLVHEYSEKKTNNRPFSRDSLAN